MRSFPLLFLILTAAACGTKQPAAETKAPAAACTPLPGTKLCQEPARKLLALAKGDRPAPPKGCEWVVNETPFASDYLLYLAAKCADGKVATLEYAGAAHKATLSYQGRELVSIYGSDEKDPNSSILFYAKEVFPKGKTCRVRPAGVPQWPADALVVDVSDAEAAKAPKDQPRSACGPLGLNEDSQTFWRVFQGFSWFFSLGQDDPPIDPGSLTIVSQEPGKSTWTRGN